MSRLYYKPTFFLYIFLSSLPLFHHFYRFTQKKMPRAQHGGQISTGSRVNHALHDVRVCEETLCIAKDTDTPDDSCSKYEVVGHVGSGAYGNAMLIRMKGHPSSTPLVAKRIPMQSATNLRRVKREIEVMRTVNHPHIMSLLDYWQTSRAVYIVMEYAQFRDLRHFVSYYQLMTKTLLPIQVLGLVRQISDALDYLHTRGIMHRDVKPENILMMSSCFLKLCDFGFSFQSECSTLATSTVGTPYYQAPEIVQGRSYTSKCDVWSAGVVAYELAFLKYPFDGDNVVLLQEKIVEGEFEISAALEGVLARRDADVALTSLEHDWLCLLSVIHGCLQVNPQDRREAGKVKQYLDRKYNGFNIPNYLEEL